MICYFMQPAALGKGYRLWPWGLRVFLLVRGQAMMWGELLAHGPCKMGGCRRTLCMDACMKGAWLGCQMALWVHSCTSLPWAEQTCLTHGSGICLQTCTDPECIDTCITLMYAQSMHGVLLCAKHTRAVVAWPRLHWGTKRRKETFAYPADHRTSPNQWG